MEISIKNKQNKDLLLAVINFDKINRLIAPLKRYQIVALDLVNKSLYLKIKNQETDIVLRIVLTVLPDNRKDLLNINSELFFYYYADYLNKQDNWLCKNVMRIMHNGLENNKQSLNELIVLLNNQCIFDRELDYFEDEDTGEQLQQNKKNITDLEKKINLDLININWPDIKSAEEIFSYDETRIRYKLVDKEDNNYFLKIFASNKDHIDYLFRINKFLAENIAVPRIVDFKKEGQIYWFLYEFLESEEKGDRDIMGLAVEQISKLHALDFNIEKNKASKFNKIKNNYYLYKEEILDREILGQAIDYFQQNVNAKGLCHFDLEMRHFIYSNNKVYLTDIDSIKYDYVILDIALFIRRLLRNKQDDLIDQFIELYFRENQMIKFDKKLLFYTTVMMVYYKEDENLINNPKLHKTLSQEIALISNYFNI